MDSQTVRRALLLATVASVASVACSSDTSVAPPSGSNGQPAQGGTPPSAPRVVTLDVAPKTGVAVDLGSTFTFSAVAVRSDSMRIAAQDLSFNSLAPGILAVNPITGIANAIGSGNAAVLVRGSGLEAVVIVTVLPPSYSGNSTALKVNSFSVVQYAPSAFAPLLNVTAASNTSVTVLDLQFWISGLGSIPSIGCGGNIPAGGTRDLNGEVYGDWTFSIGSSTQPASDDAVAVVTFIDGTGATGSVTAHGKIAAGSMPTTYTGGQNGGPCFHGRVP